MTNYERIIKMSDKELARFIGNSDCYYCRKLGLFPNGEECKLECCSDATLQWLNTESEQ